MFFLFLFFFLLYAFYSAERHTVSIFFFLSTHSIIHISCSPLVLTHGWIEVNICENGAQTLSCPAGQKISIADGYYGRQSTYICQHINMYDTNCWADNTRTKLQDECHGKQSCWVTASNSWFGDPCPDTYKYLHLAYRCKCNSPWLFLSNE